jgi:hypothetical protein
MAVAVLPEMARRQVKAELDSAFTQAARDRRRE